MKKAVQIYRVFSKELLEKNVSAYASSAAFFMFLSMIPILLLLCSIVPYTPISEANLMSVLRSLLPEMIVPIAINIVAEMYDNASAILSISALTAVWSAAKGILSLVRGLNVINDVKEKRKYLALRLEACFYTVLLLVALVLTLVIMVFGKVIVLAIVEGFPGIRYLLEMLLNSRFFISLTVLTVFFVVLYTFLPSERMRMKTQIPGAVFTSVVWSVFSWGFSFYVNKFSAFSMYGSLSTLIVIMIWMYVCMYIVLIGALVNRFFEGMWGKS